MPILLDASGQPLRGSDGVTLFDAGTGLAIIGPSLDAMAYSDVKTQFLGILNRRDITTSLVNTFMQQAIQRVQRNLRIPAMEKYVTVTMDGINPLLVPGDLLELISLTVIGDAPAKLSLSTFDSVAKLSQTAGIPSRFYRVGGNYMLGPAPLSGQVIYIHYYTDASSLSADTDANWMTLLAPDLLIYGALSYAADYFLDQRRNGFEDRFVGIMNDLQSMANQELLTAGARFDEGYDLSVDVS